MTTIQGLASLLHRSNWGCYFEPISHCSYAEHVEPLEKRYGLKGWDDESSPVGSLFGFRLWNWDRRPLKLG
jgi:hypothetical protein